MHNDPAVPHASDEWQFVAAAYARPGVAQACLLLQDELGVDVLVLLHLAFVRFRSLTPVASEQIEMADRAVREWRDKVVQPLRAVRRSLDKNDPHVHGLRADIQRCELNAERHGLSLLAAAPLMSDGMASAEKEGSFVQQIADFYGIRNGRAASMPKPEIAGAIELLERQLASAT